MMRDRSSAEALIDQHVLSQGPTAHIYREAAAVKLAQATSKQIRTIACSGMQLNPQMESENIYKVLR